MAKFRQGWILVCTIRIADYELARSGLLGRICYCYYYCCCVFNIYIYVNEEESTVLTSFLFLSLSLFFGGGKRAVKLDTAELARIADWFQSMPDEWQARNQSDKIFNYFIPLVSTRGEDTEEKTGPMAVHFQELLNQPEASYLRQIIDTLRLPVGRSRLMKILPGETVGRLRLA